MKKMWMIAAVACAALMVSCGGGEKKASVEETAKAYMEKLNAAAVAQDGDKFKQLFDEVNNYGKGLSKEELKKFDEVYRAVASEDTKAAVRYLKQHSK